jgi:hypothetical protein
MYLTHIGSYLDAPAPSAPPQPPCAPPAYEDVVKPWVVPAYATKISETMTMTGAAAHLCMTQGFLGNDSKNLGESIKAGLATYSSTTKQWQYLRDIEKLLFQRCIAKYAQCRKTPDTNAVFARGNLVEMVQLCHDMKQKSGN